MTPKKPKGLPPLKPPAARPGHRSVLVACSATGRAAWAEFKVEEHPNGYRALFWVGNARAVPDLEAARRGDRYRAVPSVGNGGDGGGDATSGPGERGDGAVGANEVVWDGWSCGVCGTDFTPVPGLEQYTMWRCGTCATLYCPGGFRPHPGVRGEAGEGKYFTWCPGCGERTTLEEHQEIAGIIDSFDSTPGRRPTAAEEGRGLGSGSATEAGQDERRGLGPGAGGGLDVRRGDDGVNPRG